MMLATAVRTLDTAAMVAAFSPSKTGRVRVTSTRYRRDPYKVKALAPVAAAAAAAPPMQQPHHDNAFYAQSSPQPQYYGGAPVASAAGSSPYGSEHDVFAPAVADAAYFAAPSSSDEPEPFVPMAMNTAFSSSGASTVSDASVATAKPSTSTRAAAAAAAPAVAITRWAVVAFKHESVTYAAPFRVAVGDAVVIEADRGEHVGTVESITAVKPKFNVPSRVVRHATPADVAALEETRQREVRTTAAVQKLSESIGLGIKIVDTEFQIDGNKLTVFFASKCFVDFRKLQRSLFREFRCRIWLVNWAEVRHNNAK